MSLKRIDYEFYEYLSKKLKGQKGTGSSGFFRFFNFLDADKNIVKFGYYANYCSLHFGNVQVMATHAKISSTWPNKAKSNLHLGISENHTICIIPLEY